MFLLKTRMNIVHYMKDFFWKKFFDRNIFRCLENIVWKNIVE
jgi:hypothetical protein